MTTWFQYLKFKTQRLFNELNFLFNPIAKIKWLNIEFDSSCNLRCPMCSLDHGKPREMMTRGLLHKITEEIVKSPFWLRIERIDLHNAGETLLHPEIIDLLMILAEAKKRAKHFPKVALLTNATLLTKTMSQQIIETGALDIIRFSVDGGNKEYFEQMRYPAKWEQVLRNVKNFISLNEQHDKPIETSIICLSHPDKPFTGVPESEDFYYMDPEFLALQEHIKIEFRNPHNWDGSTELQLDVSVEPPKKGLCMFIYNNLVILPNGDVTLCCADLNSRGVIDNVTKKSIYKLHHSLERKRASLKMYFKKRNEVALCKNCTIGMDDPLEDNDFMLQKVGEVN